MHTILLSGGSGKRIWPLSNDKRSKQFIKLTHHETSEKKLCSMVQRVWAQVNETMDSGNAILMTNRSQEEILRNQLGISVDIAIEPERRDTFPAILLACAYLVSEKNASLDDFVSIISVDTYAENSYFELVFEMQEKLIESEKKLSLVGAVPTYPSEKYGYITYQNKENNIQNMYYNVRGFVEKPTAEKAEKLISDGALWNCGTFGFQIRTLLPFFEKYKMPMDYKEIFEKYSELPKISFDYEVVENINEKIVLPYSGFWKDIGTWNTLTDQMTVQTIGNVILDKSCENTHIINELDIPIVSMGTKNMVIAASYDGILVSDKYQSSFLKSNVEMLNNNPKYEEKKWGTIKVLDRETSGWIDSQVSKILIYPNMTTESISFPKETCCITVLKGSGEIQVNQEKKLLHTGESLSIPCGDVFEITSKEELVYIESLVRV